MNFSFDLFTNSKNQMEAAWLALKDFLGDKFLANCAKIQVTRIEKGATSDHFVVHVVCSTKHTLKTLERAFQ